jgi:uncharacterized protein YjcR
MRDFSQHELRAARKLYEDGLVPVEAVAATLGISKRTLYDYIHQWGWTSRTKMRHTRQARHKAARGSVEAAHTPTKDAHADDQMTDEPCVDEISVSADDLNPEMNASSLARRLDEAVRRELVTVEHRLRRGPVATAERNARVLTALVKALTELARLERQEKGLERHDAEQDATAADECSEEPPTDMAELRTELARRLDILRRSRNSGPV